MNKLLHGYGVLWDMDGVLVDSGDAHFLSWQAVFTELGEEFSYDLFQKTFGMNNMGILQMIFGERATEKFIKEIGDKKESAFRASIQGNVQLLPGVVYWLNQFKKSGAKQAVASSGPPENIDAIIKAVNIGSYFDALVSGYDMPGKPNPDVFLKAAQSISIKSGNCLVIEDAVAGVEGAKQAEMVCIAVTTTNPREKLSAAQLIVDSLEEIEVGQIKAILL